MTWRLWKLLTGRYYPTKGTDIADARRHRLEAEHELSHTRSRGRVVRDAVHAYDQATDVDSFAELIEQAFERRGGGQR